MTTEKTAKKVDRTGAWGQRHDVGKRGRPSCNVVLTEEQRAELLRRVRASTSAQRDALRARIVLACGVGGSAEAVAARTGVSSRSVERWRSRFLKKGLIGLGDLPRAGHKSKYDGPTRMELIALACDPFRPRPAKPTLDEIVHAAQQKQNVEGQAEAEQTTSGTKLPHVPSIESLVREAARTGASAATPSAASPSHEPPGTPAEPPALTPAPPPSLEELAARAVALGGAKVELPTRTKVTRTIEELVEEAVARGIVDSISWSTYQRILAQSDIRPHLVEGWVHSPDPEFRPKVREICDLYLAAPAGSVVLSIDEKTGMQALERRFPDRPAALGRKRRREFEYIRHGTSTLLCAYDVHAGTSVWSCGPSRTADDLVRFMEKVAEHYPNQPVHIVWDNLNTHHDGPSERWTAFNSRHGGRFHFHYTPKHASWVNQVECLFSIVDRKCLRDASFTSVAQLEQTVVDQLEKRNTNPRPFHWKFTGYPLQIGAEHTPVAGELETRCPKPPKVRRPKKPKNSAVRSEPLATTPT